jgi:hypothetical protein
LAHPRTPPSSPGDKAELIHPFARFDVVPLDGAPGRITGHGPLNAFWLREHATEGDGRLSLSEWFAKAIQRKAATAAKHPERRGAVHLIALVVDEAFACTGRTLASTFFGGLVAETGRHQGVRVYRGVPDCGPELVAGAQARGRDDLLRRLQFLPNPFTANAIESVCSLFSTTLEPKSWTE